MWLAKSRFLGFAFGMTNLEPRAEYRVPSTCVLLAYYVSRGFLWSRSLLLRAARIPLETVPIYDQEIPCVCYL